MKIHTIILAFLFVTETAAAAVTINTKETIEIPTKAEHDALSETVSSLEAAIANLDDRVTTLEAGGGGVLIKHWNSGNNSERVASIAPDGREVVYSIPVGDVQAGDILIVLGEVEGTNDSSFNAHMQTRISLADSPTHKWGKEITEGNSFNITPNMHHGTATKVGTYVVPQDMTDKYVNLTVWAIKGMDIIEQDFGRLSVIRIR